MSKLLFFLSGKVPRFHGGSLWHSAVGQEGNRGTLSPVFGEWDPEALKTW